MSAHKQMTTGLIGHGRRRTGEARHKAPSVWLSPTSRAKTTGTMGYCWTPRTFFFCDKHAPSRSTGDGEPRSGQDVTCRCSGAFLRIKTRRTVDMVKEPSPLAGLAAAEIPWPFAPKHTVPVMAANPHTTAHTFLARILAPWAEALSPVSLRNSSKSRRRLSSDKRRRFALCPGTFISLQPSGDMYPCSALLQGRPSRSAHKSQSFFSPSFWVSVFSFGPKVPREAERVPTR